MEADRAALRVIEYTQQHNLPQAGAALEAAMNKFPNHPSVCVAEALYLARTGRTTTAKEKAQAAAKLNITQPPFVDALVRVLQETCAWESLAATYERLLPTQNKRTVSENLVQTYARMGAYDKLQATATALYREFNDPRYQVWMVQACLAQVPPDSTEHLFLALATRLLNAAVLTEKGKMTPTTVRAYLDVLVQQDQIDEAVSFLCSPRGSKIGLLETRLEVLATLLERQGRYKLANATSKYLWRKHPDNWVPVEIYQRTLTPPKSLLQDNTDVDAELVLEGDVEALRATVRAADADDGFVKAIELAKALQREEETTRARKMNRGPFLAELSFRHAAAIQARSHAHTTSAGDAEVAVAEDEALQEAVLAYAQRLYTKPCCYLDLSTFLTKASAEAIYAWSRTENVIEEDKNAAVRHHTRRVLGLRCYVGTWGTTADTQPSLDVMHTLMRECREAYDAAKPLSTELAWSEEGLCDGYLSVAMNIALRGFLRDGGANFDWLYRGLELQHGVDRRLNNPGWLIFAVGFASALGLVDCAALHQLAFKSIQHDTMAHVGYWPLRKGLALADVEAWESHAADYYLRVEQDCSLLRAKVFNFISWPAMKDVQRFEHAQMNSLGRWTIVAHECAAALRICQTQDNIVALMARSEAELATARAVLADDTKELLDNADETVVRSLILGNIHTDTVKSLAATLAPVVPVQARRQEALRLVDSLLLLHDVAMLERHRQTLAHAPKPRKASRKKAAAAAQSEHVDPASTGPTLYTQASTASTAPRRYLPLIEPVGKALEAYLASSGETGCEAAAADALKSAFDSLLSEGREAFEAFLYPQAYILAALVRTATMSKVPVKAWATELHTALHAAQTKLSGVATGAWAVPAVLREADATSLTHSLYAEKEHRIHQYIADLLVDVGATMKRR